MWPAWVSPPALARVRGVPRVCVQVLLAARPLCWAPGWVARPHRGGYGGVCRQDVASFPGGRTPRMGSASRVGGHGRDLPCSVPWASCWEGPRTESGWCSVPAQLGGEVSWKVPGERPRQSRGAGQPCPAPPRPQLGGVRGGALGAVARLQGVGPAAPSRGGNIPSRSCCWHPTVPSGCWDGSRGTVPSLLLGTLRAARPAVGVPLRRSPPRAPCPHCGQAQAMLPASLPCFWSWHTPLKCCSCLWVLGLVPQEGSPLLPQIPAGT